MRHRLEEARTIAAAATRDFRSSHLNHAMGMTEAMLEGDAAAIKQIARQMTATRFHDPEGWYYWGRTLVHAEEPVMGCDLLVRAMSSGFHGYPVLVRDPWLDPVRSDPLFGRALRIAERGHREALAAFEREGGPSLLAMR
jgi:hypothetical protein